MTIGWATVATNFAALSPIEGIKVLDIGHLSTDCRLLIPILFPWPNGLIKGIKPTRHTLALGSVNYRIEYAMTWRYLHAAIAGGLGGIYADYGSFLANVDALYSAIITNADLITGCKTIIFPDVPALGPVTDPAGNQYHGCDLVFQVIQEI